MKTVVFFGHSRAPSEIKHKLSSVLIDLIENEQANSFYVGNNGDFDYLVRKELKKLCAKYSHIHYSVVLAYMPIEKPEFEWYDYSDTIYPDGLETVPKKFAIDKRNRWMVERADIVVTYVKRSYGGAAKFKALAERKGKIIINIAE